MNRVKVSHVFPAVFDDRSRILILGSFPSVKSREMQFYYGHKQNRFWKMVSEMLKEEVPQTIEEKKGMLLRNHIALWDVIDSCTIIGSSDSSIEDVKANDIAGLLKKTEIVKVFLNGRKAYELYNKHVLKQTGVEGILLPSTSSANAGRKYEDLLEDWQMITEYLGEEQ